MSYKGKKNIYTCEECHEHIVTVDVDDGTTPFLTGCVCTKGCAGLMKSSMYNVFHQSVNAEWEWYRPSVFSHLSEGTRDHIAKGGLILRRAAQAEHKRGLVHVTALLLDALIEAINDELADADVVYPAGRDAGHAISFDDETMRRALTAALNCEPEVYTIGDKTMAQVFMPGRITNLSDLQAVLNAVEQALPPTPSSHVDGARRYHLEWIAGARPPVHPNPMTGRQSFGTFAEAIAFMQRQAPDAKFVLLEESTTSTSDRSVQARIALNIATEGKA